MQHDIFQVMARRRSARRFGSGVVSAQDLEQVVTAGLQAPSGHNDQSVYLVAVRQESLIQTLSDRAKAGMREAPLPWMVELGQNPDFHIYYHAPVVILVTAFKGAVAPHADACAAIQNMLLAAEGLDLAACWIGFARFAFDGHADMGHLLRIPEGHEVQYGVALGPRAEGWNPLPPPRKRPSSWHLVEED